MFEVSGAFKADQLIAGDGIQDRCLFQSDPRDFVAIPSEDWQRRLLGARDYLLCRLP